MIQCPSYIDPLTYSNFPNPEFSSIINAINIVFCSRDRISSSQRHVLPNLDCFSSPRRSNFGELINLLEWPHVATYLRPLWAFFLKLATVILKTSDHTGPDLASCTSFLTKHQNYVDAKKIRNRIVGVEAETPSDKVKLFLNI